MAPLFEHYGVQLWMPEVGGRVDSHAEDHEQTMLALGLQSKREITRTRIRVRTAMATQTREQGRYLGGRPPYGYRLADAGPHPNKAHAAWGRRAHRLEPDPETAPVVRVDVRPAAGRAQRGADHPGAERCRDPVPVRRRPEAEPAPDRRGVDAAHGGGDPGQPAVHRPAGVEPAAHRLRPGRPGQHRAGAQAGAAVEPARGLGHLRPPAHPALVSEADFIAAQDAGAPRGPAGPAARRYLLAGLLACGRCGRRLESAWSNGRPAYRCRHGHPSAARPDPGRPKNTYVREDQILPHLAALAILLASGGQPGGNGTVQVTAPAETAGLIDWLRTSGAVLTYDPETRTIRTSGSDPVAVTAGRDR